MNINQVLGGHGVGGKGIKPEDEKALKNMQFNILELAMNVEKKNSSKLAGVGDGMFVETFMDLTNITLSKGKFDSTGKKIYLP